MRLLTFAWLLTAAACGGAADPRPELTVYAAVSLRETVAETARAFEAAHGARVTTNFAGSNVLARQIAAAPGADAFLSADAAWVDDLVARGRAVAATRRPFLENRLVVAVRADSPYRLADPRELPELGFRHLAVADPEAVPAGRYARAALERLEHGGTSVWEALAPRLAPAADARAALALVESDPEILGVVYRTDARATPRARVLHELAPIAEAPILYWAVLVKGAPRPELGRRFLDFLAGPEAAAIAERHGFLVPEPAR